MYPIASSTHTFNPPRATSRVIVKDLTLSEVPVFNQQYIRPFTANVTEETISSVGNRVDQLGGASVAPSTFTGIAGSIVSPSAMNPIGIQIPNGWGERRFSFVLEVEIHLNTGAKYRDFLQGYTSHYGVGNSMNNNIDPEMEFIVNSYTRISTITEMTTYGPRVYEQVLESCHVMNGRILSQDPNLANGNYLRPQDVFTGIQSQRLDHNYQGLGNPNDQMIDTRSTINQTESTSRRNNVMPSHYLSKIIDSHRQARAFSDYGHGADDIYARGLDYTREAFPTDNPFFVAIGRIRNIPASTTFTIKDLSLLEGASELNVNVLRRGATNIAMLPDAVNSESWDGANMETIFANVLSTALPALMSSLLFLQVSFSVTNMTQTGEVELIVGDHISMTSADIRSHFNRLRERLDLEVLRDLSYNNTLPYFIRVDCSLVHGSQITVSISGGPRIEFFTPTFSDSLLVPVITGKREMYTDLVSNMDTLMTRTGLDNIAGSTVGF